MRIFFVSLALVGGIAGCGGNRGKIMADTMQFDAKQGTWIPLIDYKAPDIDEITGIDSDDEASSESASPAPAANPGAKPAATPGAGSAQNPHK